MAENCIGAGLFCRINGVISGKSAVCAGKYDNSVCTVAFDRNRCKTRGKLIAGENVVCLGCDLDGIGSTPEGIGHIDDLPRVFDRLSKDLGYKIADKIFFSNAYNFFINNLPQKEKTVL